MGQGSDLHGRGWMLVMMKILLDQVVRTILTVKRAKIKYLKGACVYIAQPNGKSHFVDFVQCTRTWSSQPATVPPQHCHISLLIRYAAGAATHHVHGHLIQTVKRKEIVI